METKHQGSCHCGVVKFEITLDLDAGVSRCNCSVCTKLSTMGAIAKPPALAVLAGEKDLTEYAWGGKTATRYFCRHCGVTCFLRGHLEQLGGAYVSVNVNSLDGVELSELSPTHWDGRHDNWQAGPRKTPWPILTKA